VSWLARVFGRADAPEPEGDPLRVTAVQAVIAELRPLFRADGGDVELVSVEGGRITVRFRGACRSCSASEITLHEALEPRLRERCAWFEELRAEG